MPATHPDHRGGLQWLMAVPALALLGWFVVAVGVAGVDPVAWWSGLGVPALNPAFADAWGALSGAACRARGIDAYVSNPCDPLGRTFVYPRLWLLAGHIGLEGRATALGIVSVLAYLGSCFALFRPRDAIEALLTGALVVSPAALLGIERGNNDLLVFALVAAMLVAARATSPAGRPIATLLLWAGTLLKIYPAFLCPIMAAPCDHRQTAGRRIAAQLWFVLAGCGIAGLFLFMHHDLLFVAATDKHKTSWAYGSTVVLNMLDHGSPPRSVELAWRAVVAGAAVGSAALLLMFRAVPVAVLSRQALGERNGLLAASCFYAASYLLTTSFNYKLILLLPAVPALYSLARDSHRRASAFGVLALALIVVVTASLREIGGFGSTSHVSFVLLGLHELAGFGLCVLALAIVAAELGLRWAPIWRAMVVRTPLDVSAAQSATDCPDSVRV